MPFARPCCFGQNQLTKITHLPGPRPPPFFFSTSARKVTRAAPFASLTVTLQIDHVRVGGGAGRASVCRHRPPQQKSIE